MVRAGEEPASPSRPGAAYSQHSMRQVGASYRMELGTLGSLLGRAGPGGSAGARLKYSLVPDGEGGFSLDCAIAATRRIVPGVGAPVEKPLWQSRSRMDARASVTGEWIGAPGEDGAGATELTVSLEESPLLGKNKVIRLLDNGRVRSELMVGPDEPIATLFQIAVFAGTLAGVPEEGIRVRWVLNGKPIPALLKSDREAAGDILMLRDDLDDSGARADPILRFVFAGDASGFALPDAIIFRIEGREMVFSREKE